MKFLMISGLLLSSMIAQAKECVFVVDRTVCPGKSEAELLKPYGGKKMQNEMRDLLSEKECLAAAETASKIVRPGQYAQKKVHSIGFDGKALNGEFQDQKNCQ